MKIQSRDRRVQKFLDHNLRSPAYRWDELTDPRCRRGRRWKFSELLDGAMSGLLAGCVSLREVEALTEEMGEMGRQYVPRRVPDTTLSDLFPRLCAGELRAKHVRQVRSHWRAKSFAPVGLPCGVLAIDGKGLGALEHDADGTAQRNYRAHDGVPYWLARMLRAVLTSAEGKPCIDQMPIGKKTNETGCFIRFFDGIMDAYGAGDLFEILTMDAGLTSRANADHIHAANKAYVMALKGTQPELLAEATRLLEPRRDQEPDAETGWEVYQGKTIRRRLFRTQEMAGYHDWAHLRQAWLVEQTTRHSDGKIEVELRYFLTSVPWGRLSAAQILQVVRGHWGIENDCFWTLDTQWLEDSVPWCSTGNAVEVLSWLRLMAYNLIQLARRRHLRLRDQAGTQLPPPPWRRVFTWVRQALRLSMELPAVCG